MKLLIITQKVDGEDGVLGFFCGWLEKLSYKFEKINVICLQKGKCNLPKNVCVWSLGKEERVVFKIVYVFRFFKYIYQLRNEYTAVFVHMNKEYLFLGGFLWRLWNKKIVLWYNHKDGGFLANYAYFFVNKIFYTSPFSYFAQRKKAVRMPAGINIKLFKSEQSEKIQDSILCIGRVSPIKRLEILLKALEKINNRGINFVLDVVGKVEDKDMVYELMLKKIAKELICVGKVRFLAGVPNYLAVNIYNKHEIVVNLTNNGSYDKTILEAMACEDLVVVSNESFKDIVPKDFIFKENDVDDLEEKIVFALRLSKEQKLKQGKKMRAEVIAKHGLDILIKDFCAILED